MFSSFTDFEELIKVQKVDMNVFKRQEEEKHYLILKNMPSPMSAAEPMCDLSAGFACSKAIQKHIDHENTFRYFCITYCKIFTHSHRCDMTFISI